MSAMNRRRFSLLAAGALAAPLIVRNAGESLAQDATPEAAPASADSLEAMEGQVYSTGPNGEEPTAASEVTLSEEELAEIQAMGATAAIVMHYGGNDWSVAQIAGLKDQFGKMGIEVIAETDAGFDPATQVSDIETTLARNPSIIVSIPTDPVATAAAYRQAAEQGVKLVFMDNVPQGFTPGTDYVSVVSADNYGNGVASAHIMAEALGGAGKIGLVYHAADFFVTKQRYDAFKATIAEHYPDIEIVEEQGIAGPDFAGDGDRVAAAMLTKHQDLNGIWAVWDVPAEGVVTAIRTAGREGNVIVLASTSLEVADACSGIRSLVSLLTLGIVVGYFADRRAWVRMAIAILTVPIAIVTNGGRVAGTGIATHYFGPEVASGAFHEVSGLLVFVAALALLFFALRLILFIAPQRDLSGQGTQAVAEQS